MPASCAGRRHKMKQCKVIKGGAAFHGKQGLDYFSGGSAQSADSDGICMHMVVLPPGARAICTDPNEQESVVLI
jgi:uncharacterized RmlC-like cupin family protein